MVEVIPDRFEYRAGVTYVGSTVGDLLAAGAGVCQDFAHLALLLLRRHGIGARYVSGYLWAPSNGDEASRRGRDPRVGRGAAAERLGADVDRRGPDEPHARRRVAREDRPRPPVRRRPADQGRLPRRGGFEPVRLGPDDARRCPHSGISSASCRTGSRRRSPPSSTTFSSPSKSRCACSTPARRCGCKSAASSTRLACGCHPTSSAQGSWCASLTSSRSSSSRRPLRPGARRAPRARATRTQPRPRILDDEAWWVCPADQRRIARIGELPR